MAQFSSNELVSLERTVDNNLIQNQTDPKVLKDIYEIERCIEWIKANNFKRVCLQFPDHLLPDSVAVAMILQESLDQVVYVMGDSAYESCCVDYATAKHVESDAIIHYGPRCLSKWTGTIQCLCVYEKKHLNIEHLHELFFGKFKNDYDSFQIVIDVPYIHKIDKVMDAFQGYLNVVVIPLNIESIESTLFSAGTTLYVGQNDRKLMNFKFMYRPKELYYYNPHEKDPLIKNYTEDNAILKRRRYLIEKIKDSCTVGIIIGTLVVENYMKIIDRIKIILKAHSKTYYVISVGRPTVAKLANFSEMDLYVLICCSMSDVYDSREFFKPIVTPYDVEVALNPAAEDLNFSYDFNSYISTYDLSENEMKYIASTPDVSLITGNMRGCHRSEENNGPNSERQILTKLDGTVAINEQSGAGFLSTRSFQGLEQNLGCTEVKLAEEGRRGIAQKYHNENF